MKANMNTQSKKKRFWKMTDTKRFWLYISPWIVGFLCFTVIPISVSLYLSFTNARVATIGIRQPVFLGWQNYVELFTVDRLFVKSIGNTFVYAFCRVGASILWAFVVALLINRKIPGRTALKLMIYLPCVLPAVASGLLFQLAFFQEKSIFVYIVHQIFGGKEFALNTQYTAMPALIITGTVFGVGGNMILLLAALNGVPQDVLEAASLDGAKSWRKFFKITLPMISPTLFFMLVTGFIGTLQAYAEIELVLGRSEYTLTMAMFVVENSFNGIGIGYALAASWVIFLIILAFTLAFYKVTIKRVYFGGDQ